jgi:hypothetical protein
MSAARALIEMSAEHGSATPRHGQQHFDMLPGDSLTASFDECVSRSSDQIGHLERWPVHLLSRRGDCSAFRGSLWFPGSASEDIQPARDARTNAKEFHINPAAEGGGESIAGATCAEAAAACVRDAKERLAVTTTM